MDTTTLVVANCILFSLYAAVMLVNARIVGGARGAFWFAGSNLLRGASMAVVVVQWLRPDSTRYVGAAGAVCSVIGTMMLHQAFAALLERGRMMRSIQYILAGAVTAGAAVLMLFPALEPLLGVVLCSALAIQFAVVSLLVFRFSGEEVGPAGRLTGMALAVYSVMMLVRAYAAASRGETLIRLVPWVMHTWLLVCLITSAAVAFGFMSLSTARLRLELTWRAQVDELTGLLNRWALKRLVMREIVRSRSSRKPLAVVMMDLDGMKLVNDTRGHACGDVVLQAVGSVLQEFVRPQDSVARMGGDEFCVLLPQTSICEALEVAERLRREVDDLVVHYRGETIGCHASLGVTSSELCELAWQSLVDSADSALYAAKREGKNQVVMAKPTKELDKAEERKGPELISEAGSSVQ